MRALAVGSAVLAGALLLGGCGLAPDTFVGPPPEVQHTVVCSTGQNSQCAPDARHASLRWAVGDVPYSTRLSVTEGEPQPSMAIEEVDGTIELENPDACPATLQWTLTPEPGPTRPPAPPLTPDEPESASLDDDPIPAGTQEVRLDFRRLDRLPCSAQVLWSDASFD